MRWNALVDLPFEHDEAAPPRRWWLGWLQLLCAWVVCMLICANLALILAKGLPVLDGGETARKATACESFASLATRPATTREEHADRAKARTPDCSGL